MNNELSENNETDRTFCEQAEEALSPHSGGIFDERFSSKMALQTMIDGGLKKKERQNKALVDEISATIILQGYMESKRMKQ